MRFLRKFAVGLAALLLCGLEAEAEDTIIAVLSENGPIPRTSSVGTLTMPLFCEGHIECGSVRYSDIDLIRLDGEGLELFATVRVCRGTSSCVTARRAHFLGNALPVARPDGVLYAESMVEHEPIQCPDATGEFFVPGCTGKLKLDYRCLNLADPAAGEFVQALASSYVVSARP
jgi:hypothetical protein